MTKEEVAKLIEEVWDQLPEAMGKLADEHEEFLKIGQLLLAEREFMKIYKILMVK